MNRIKDRTRIRTPVLSNAADRVRHLPAANFFLPTLLLLPAAFCRPIDWSDLVGPASDALLLAATSTSSR
jgi:hypothetical protein